MTDKRVVVTLTLLADMIAGHTSLYIDCLFFREQKKQLAAFLSFFQFNLESDNQSVIWDCDCTLYQLQRFIKEEAADIIREAVYEGSFLFRYSNFQSWKCKVNSILKPQTQIRPFLEMPPEKFICEDKNLTCPKNCSCYRGAHSLNIFVDCTGLKLIEIPPNLPMPEPGGQLVVNLAHNSIRQYKNCRDKGYMWLQNVTTLNLEHNEITPNNSDDTDNFLHCLTSVQYLYMAYNNIEYLPLSIQYIDYKNLSISGNKLECDCTTLWLKKWLQKKNATIQLSQTMHCKGVGKLHLAALVLKRFIAVI